MRLPEHLGPGRAEPFGALARDGGVNFAVFSDHAQRIELCIFDVSATTEVRRYALHGPQDGVFHGFLEGVGPGLVYGLRAYGPYAPDKGHRFNAHKLLLDPWAREIVGRHRWRAEHYGYEVGHPAGNRSFDSRDNAVHALKARVAPPPQPAPGWHNAPRIAGGDVVLYELHVRGFGMGLPGLPDELRGTYAGLAHPAALAHFKALGVTTLELLPVQYHLDEPGLAERGLTNYWGYNTLGFFCPDPRLAAADPTDPTAVADEFRRMVATLHEHGLEVVLDVVYNHTPEGDESGPTLSMRGLDQASWYRLAGDERVCENLSGCGNTLNVTHPRVTQFVLDSLRYWALEMGVDGFRFDLAPVLGRTRHGFERQAAFFTALAQDPVLARTRLIAEPWDTGHGGYQLGHFASRWLEWNDKYRDSVRRYWLASAGVPGVSRGEFARRFSASNDLFHHGQRSPLSSVNYVAVHDGFTLADVVSYSRKHNQANGEDNRDGSSNEVSASFGVEGASADAAVKMARTRVQRAMLATLLLSQGTPMLCAGDEIGNSQQGNNNAYCQDNPAGWLDWARADHDLLAFVQQLIALRRAEPALRHAHWFRHATATQGERSLGWLAPAGHDMQVHDWHDAQQRAFACRIDGAPSDAAAAQPGSRHLLLAFNPESTPLPFTLPPGQWQVAIDSAGELRAGDFPAAHRPLAIPAHALVALRMTDPA